MEHIESDFDLNIGANEIPLLTTQIPLHGQCGCGWKEDCCYEEFNDFGYAVAVATLKVHHRQHIEKTRCLQKVVIYPNWI